MLLKLSALLLVSLIIGCGSTNSDTITHSTTPGSSVAFDSKHKSYLYNLFKTKYLWYDKVPEVDYNQYTSPNEMIDALKYAPFDKWSTSLTLQEYENMANQETQGFGCYFNGPTIFFMDIDSPCDRAGLQRGDTLNLINHAQITNESYVATQNNLGVEVVFTVNRDGVDLDIPITPSFYTYKTTKSKIFTRPNGVKVGLLIYNAYSSTSAEELEDVFTYFHNNHIDELIIDLRYNSGGSLAVSSILLDKIAGYSNEDAVQMKLVFNNNNSSENSELTFEKDENSLNIDRVFFLTSKYSASASEVTINSLKPYMDVKLIGSKTHGKPVGMEGELYKNSVVYFLINFAVYNANNEGNFFDGIPVDCNADDDIYHLRTDENEDMLQGALYYIDNGSCS
jgi:carboxyl-terminal processing protease